jgi:hypothetical protein
MTLFTTSDLEFGMAIPEWDSVVCKSAFGCWTRNKSDGMARPRGGEGTGRARPSRGSGRHYAARREAA